MEANKFQVTIPEQRKILLEVPPEAPTGDAEMLVLFARKKASRPQDSLLKFLDEVSLPESARSQSEIDSQILNDRDEWV